MDVNEHERLSNFTLTQHDTNERHKVVDIHLEIDSEDRLRTKLYDI